MKYRLVRFFTDFGFVQIPLKASNRAEAIETSETIVSLTDGEDYFITEIDGLKDVVFFAKN